eukprot:6962673-Karenia_brevis.AAC.1
MAVNGRPGVLVGESTLLMLVAMQEAATASADVFEDRTLSNFLSLQPPSSQLQCAAWAEVRHTTHRPLGAFRAKQSAPQE